MTKDYRKTSVASSILTLAMGVMATEGVNRFVVSAEMKADIKPLMSRLGFKETELKFGRKL